jgi:hypothetical protein
MAWRVEVIPDPRDPDPVQYAVLAGFAETMAICFNERIDLGMSRIGSDAVTNPISSEVGRTLSREESIAFTRVHYERAPSWTACERACGAFRLLGSSIFPLWGYFHHTQY